ncbi:MAG TPA: pentapeptide repeat-containing protein, partial [Oscillatoriales cyanobacterium M4454_W2019_049]|nr:pentapeptide repeat-containing protein [Oscillatoriales cyanobacterium M4454_W2019_049]
MDADELLARYADELLARYAADELLGQYAAGERDFYAVDLSDAHLSNADLSDIDLSGSNLSHIQLYGVKLDRANLGNANLRNANLYGVQFDSANLNNADLREVELRDVNFTYANLSEADFSYARLVNTDFEGADLSCADFHHANLNGANLSEVDLSCANFSFANLKGANLTNAIQGFNETTLSSDRTRIDLRNADLSYADLSNADLSYADLSNANLRDAILVGTNLSNALLDGAAVEGTILAYLQQSSDAVNPLEIWGKSRSANQDLVKQIATFKAGYQWQESEDRPHKRHVQRRLPRRSSPKAPTATASPPPEPDSVLADFVEEIQIPPKNDPPSPPPPPPPVPPTPQDRSPDHSLVWEGLTFRSLGEAEVAKALDRANLLFFLQSVARLDCGGRRISDPQPGFVACYRLPGSPNCVRWGLLMVDSVGDDKLDLLFEEQERELNYERGGIRIYRFSYSRCLNNPDDVVREFVDLLKLQC